MKYIAYLLLLLPLTACATQKLSPEGARVRVVPTGASLLSQCQHLGLVRSFQPVIVGGLSAAHLDIRNKVAAAGGNAIAISTQQSDPQGHGTVVGDAYSCAF